MTTSTSTPVAPPADLTPPQHLENVITRGGDRARARAIYDKHIHPGAPNLWRDEAAACEARTALEELVPTPAHPEPSEVTAEPAPDAPEAPTTSEHSILAVWDAGFAGEIVPIRPGSKAPSMPGWQSATIERADIAGWARKGRGFGLRTAHFPCIDSDVTDEKLAAIVWSAIVEAFPGAPLLKRTGSRPKFAVPFRAGDEPLMKRVLTLRNGSDLGKIEVLGVGQQFVISGLHPSTGRPYFWSLGDRMGGVEVLAEVGAAGLPVLDAAAFDRFTAILTQKLEALGIEVVVSSRRDRTAPSPAALHAPSLAALEQAVRAMPNPEDLGRDGWIARAHAIKGAGADWPAEAFELWQGFSERWAGGFNAPEEVLRVWETLGAPTIGWAALLGWTDRQLSAKHDFEKLPIEQAVPVSVPVEQILPAGADEGEQSAALLRSASAAFMLEAPACADGALWTRWSALRAAAELTHPDEPFFYGTVVPAAEKLRAYRQLDRFALLLTTGLRQNAGWADRNARDRQMFLRAAFALVVGPVFEQPVPQLVVDSGDLPYLVKGLLPTTGTALLVGPPNQGKSFVALDLACRVAAGAPSFAGLPLERRGPVLYFSSEDAEGLLDRVADWTTAHQLDVSGLRIYNAALSLSNFGIALEGLQSALANLTESPALIVVDTIRDALGSADENDAATMAQAFLISRTISRMTGALVLLVGHSPHATETRLRGSSAATASLDVSLSIKQEDRTITAIVEKRRRGPKGVEFKWYLAVSGEKAVLHEGADPRTDFGGNLGTDADARLVAEVLRSIASSDHPATSSQLHDAIADNSAGMSNRDGERRGKGTGAARRYRAIQRALELKWIAVSGTTRARMYTPGPITPPAEVADLEGLAS